MKLDREECEYLLSLVTRELAVLDSTPVATVGNMADIMKKRATLEKLVSRLWVAAQPNYY